MPKQKRIMELDFIRFVACLGVIAHHYCGELQNRSVTTPWWFLGKYNRGNFGWLFVTIFFVVSGMAIMNNNLCIKREDVWSFYKKRWLSLFPAFYFVWILVYIEKVIENCNFLYAGSIKNMIWSIFALDGYVSCVVPTYYQVGEWFLAPIVIIYLLYPLINWGYRKNKYIFGLVIVFLFLLEDNLKITIQTGPFRSIISCICSFYMGMLLLPFVTKIRNPFVFVASLLLSGVFLIGGIRIADSENITVHVSGMAVVILLWNIGHYIMKLPVLDKVIIWISEHCYHIFLLQHVVILQVLSNCIPVGMHLGRKMYFVILILIAVLIMFDAWIIKNSEGKIKSIIRR